jgi:hypothetical protein
MSRNGNPCLDWALKYADKNYHIFPAKPGEKKSRLSKQYAADGQNWGMTFNAERIKKYWQQFPDSNVCIVTGDINGLFVVETDTAAHGKDGAAELQKLIAANGGEWPDTMTAESPTGSIHYYFAWPEGNVVIRNSTGELGDIKTPGVDVRGEGGMVVAPPSVNPKYEASYRWKNPGLPGPANAPQWLIDLVAEKPTERKPGDPQADIDKIRTAMEIIPNDKPDMAWEVAAYKTGVVNTRTGWEGWNVISMALFRATGGSDEGSAIHEKWCCKNPTFNNAKSIQYMRDTWRVRYRRSPPKTVGAGLLFAIADDTKPGWAKIWDHEHVKEIIEAKVKEAKADKSKYKIKLTVGNNNNLRELEAFLIDAKVPLYVYGKTLVRPITSDVEAMQDQMTKVVELYDVTSEYLEVKAQDHIVFEKFKGKKWVVTEPPTKLVKKLLSLVGDWKFPVIRGVISTPTMRRDGSILSQSGYDPKTRLLLIEPPELPAMPDKLSKDDASDAIALLEELISEFPFIDNVAKSVALSAMITPVVRGAFMMAPMFVNKAPTPASGKSYLFDIVSAIAIGQRMPVVAASSDKKETDKRLDTALLTGRPLIDLDNVNGELESATLSQCVERPYITVRFLGKSEDRTIETCGFTVYATGNNITLVGDLIRRSLICSLDPNEEKPEQHEYKNDPVKMVLSDRGKYIAACLTICRAFMQSKAPKAKPKLGSYEGWSDLVRSALIWLDREDPVKSMDIGRAEDPVLIDLAAIMTEWCVVIGTGEVNAVTLNKVIDLCNEDGSKGYDSFNKKYPDFYDAICRVSSSYGKPPDQRRFGNWARGIKGRLCNGMKLVNKPGHAGVAQWWVQHSDPRKDSPGTRHADNVVNVAFNERDTTKPKQR